MYLVSSRDSRVGSQTADGADIDLLLTQTENRDVHHGFPPAHIQEIFHEKLILLGLQDVDVKVAVVEKLRRHQNPIS